MNKLNSFEFKFWLLISFSQCCCFEANLFKEVDQRNKSHYDNSLCTDVHTLISWEALLRPTSDGQNLTQQLDVLQKLRGYSPTQLYCEILRACCLGLAETVDSSGELRWAVFTFLKVPSLLLRLHRAIHGDNDKIHVSKIDIFHGFWILIRQDWIKMHKLSNRIPKLLQRSSVSFRIQVSWKRQTLNASAMSSKGS